MKLLEFIKQDDKRKHFAICLLLTLIGLPLLGFIAGTVLTLSIGLLKEIWDKYYGSGFCWYDMLANGLGWLFGLCIYGVYI